MNTHLYHIVDFEGFTLCEIISRPTNKAYDEYAKLYVVELLPVIADQYGTRRAYYMGGE